MTYWRLHYHLIWATFERKPTITVENEKIFYGVLYKKGKEMDLKIHASGTVDDHVHVVVSIPPKLAIADCVRHLKGASAYAINNGDGGKEKFKWQEGYGALTVSERSLKTIMEYAANQKQHHKDRSMVAVYERIDEERNSSSA